jgi:hypothetical protein
MDKLSLSLVPKIRSIDDLLQDFEQLISASSHPSSLKIEEEKLAIIEQIVVKIKQDTPPVFIVPVDEGEKETSLKKKLRRALYYTLLLFGVLEDAANGFFFGSALFALIPAISNPTLFIAAISYACIESTLFYLFDSAELKDAIGIEDPHTKLSSFIKVYSDQVKVATELNQYLGMISSLNIESTQYARYLRFSLLVNQDLKKKYAVMCKTKETWLKKTIRISVFAFGAISSLAGSYFMAVTIMSLLSVPLITTPVGIMIIILTMVVGIAFHYAMDASSMTRVVNPDYEKYQTLKQDMGRFDETYPANLLGLQALRQRFEKKKMVDGSTQTDDKTDVRGLIEPREVLVDARMKMTTRIEHSMFAPKPVTSNLEPQEELVLQSRKIG